MIGKYTIDKSIYIYTKTNDIDKSEQRIKEKEWYIYGKIPIYKKDVLYYYIRNQSGQNLKRKECLYCFIYRKYPYREKYSVSSIYKRI